LRALVEAAFERLEDGEHADVVAADLQRRVERPIAAEQLDAWFGSMSADDVAAVLLTPPAHELRRLGLSRDELVEVARRWMPTSAQYDERNEQWWLALFDSNVPHPAGHGLAYHPPDETPASAWDPTPEEVVELALSYRPIQL
jgi:hypothetical protein